MECYSNSSLGTTQVGSNVGKCTYLFADSLRIIQCQRFEALIWKFQGGREEKNPTSQIAQTLGDIYEREEQK